MRLQIENVSKRYNKKKYGIQDFSLTVENGILGLLGPNGAGKSTLLRMIATVSKPTNGLICLNKNNIVKDPNYMRMQLGFLPQDFGLYPNLNAYEFLHYVAAMKGLGGSGLKQRIAQLIDGLNLSNAASKPIGSYSGGMKQRVGIAQALLNDPKVILFDEPTVGLDPEERVRFRNLISDLANDRIVILSSHIVSDISTIADQVAVMKNGKLLCAGAQEDLIEPIRNQVFEVSIHKEELSKFQNNHFVLSTAKRGETIAVRYISASPVVGSEAVSATLEDAYLFQTKSVKNI